MEYSDINPLRYSPKIIKKRENFKCEHGHNGMTHPACFNREFGIQERIGALDIEADNLDADFGILLSWAIKTVGEDETWYDYVIAKDLDSGVYDGRIVAELVSTMWKYDRLVTHYGNARRFDMPFIRARYLWLKARGLYDGPDFPERGMIWQSDTYTMARGLLKLSSNRQGNVADVIQAEDIKTSINKDYWRAIKHGSKASRRKAIEYIVDHNIKDCIQLEKNYLLLRPYAREARTSI